MVVGSTIKPLLTVADLAVYLGTPKSWIYENLAGAQPNTPVIPFVRVGREYRFRQSEVDAWLEAKRGGTPLRFLDAA